MFGRSFPYFHHASAGFISSIVFLLQMIYANQVYAQQNDPSPLHFPSPKNIDNMLFYLQRDPNINTVIYALNLQKNGDVNPSEPLHAYWIRYGENGEKKELSFIQRKFAYGILAKAIGNDRFELRFIALKKQAFYLLRTSTDQKYFVLITVKDKKIKLNRLFIRIVGGSFWSPNVRYAQVEGFDLESGKPVSERININ